MKRLGLIVVVLLVVLSAALSGSGAAAQDDPQGTISALRTQVADSEATSAARGKKLNEQRTRIAELTTDGVPSASETATVAPRNTEAVAWVEAVPGVDYYVYTAEDAFGSVYAFGEVRNGTSAAIGAPAVSLMLTDADGNVMAAYDLASIYPNVDPGTSTPYQIWLDSVTPGSWVKEEVEIAFFDVGPFQCTLEVRDLEEVEKSDSRLVVEGNVLNAGLTPADGIIVFAAVYRADGLFAGMITDGSDQGSVPPGKRSRFRISGPLPAGFAADAPAGDYSYRLFIGMSLGDARC